MTTRNAAKTQRFSGLRGPATARFDPKRTPPISGAWVPFEGGISWGGLHAPWGRSPRPRLLGRDRGPAVSGHGFVLVAAWGRARQWRHAVALPRVTGAWPRPREPPRPGPRPNELPFLSTREGRSPSQPAAGSAPGARNRQGSRPRTPPARPRPAIVRDRRRDVREGTHLGAELLSASPTPPVRSGARTVRVRRTAARAALTPSAFVAHMQARVQRDAWRAA